MMKMRLLSLSLLFVLSYNAFAQEENDTIAPMNFNPQIGFFQKVYSDEKDPRFMVSDSKDNFKFGVGGTLLLTGFYDIDGAVDNRGFSIYSIPIPTDYCGNFGLMVSNSRVNFKVVGTVMGKPLVSFLEIGVDKNTTNIKLRQAYLSYGGFTIGHTYSMFNDLDGGVMTVDLEGPNTSVGKTHPLIAYRHNIGRHLSLAVGVETPAFEEFTEKIDVKDVNNPDSVLFHFDKDFQQMPDFTFHIKYKSYFGHVQFGALFRTLYYYVSDKPDTYEKYYGKDRSEFAYGFALSSNINITKKLVLAVQGVGGRGISEYINNISSAHIDLLAKRKIGENCDYGNPVIATPIIGGYAGLQYSFTDKITTSAVYGQIHIFREDGYQYSDNFEDGSYFAINAFYSVDKYLRFGLEYLNGYKRVYEITDNNNVAHHDGKSSRFDISVKYSF